MKKLGRKQKGSKAFKKAQKHRSNYINWSINELNLNNINQINLEKLRQVGSGSRKSRYLQSFAYKEIRTAITKLCFFSGVRLEEQSAAYRSQRCSDCGFVHKSNRKAKMFGCRSCSFVCDADLNAALNHRVALPELVRDYRLPNKTTGFFWMPSGLYDADGLELTVPIA